MSREQKITGKHLNKLWNVGTEHALYHKGSSWYHVLERFPGALFDPNGYVLFTSEEEYKNCKYLRIGKHLSVPDGIYSIPFYVLVETGNEDFSQILGVQEPEPVWIMKKIQKNLSKNNRLSISVSPKIALDIGEPEPSRVKSTTYRILRDTTLAQKIKMIHDYECQICGLTIQLKNGERYAEAHHIKPLGAPHNGPDIAENIICVCPNHHAQLDYSAIPLNITTLRKQEEHKIGQEFIKYHNEKIYSS